jgi:hypothetical protein
MGTWDYKARGKASNFFPRIHYYYYDNVEFSSSFWTFDFGRALMVGFYDTGRGGDD